MHDVVSEQAVVDPVRPRNDSMYNPSEGRAYVSRMDPLT